MSFLGMLEQRTNDALQVFTSMTRREREREGPAAGGAAAPAGTSTTTATASTKSKPVVESEFGARPSTNQVVASIIGLVR
jgi:hypothetical protein